MLWHDMQDMIGHAVTKQPHLLGLSDVHIRECLDFFTTELNINPNKLGRMLVVSPQVCITLLLCMYACHT